MKKYIMLSALLISLILSVQAQENTEDFEVNGGGIKFSASILFGNGSFMTEGLEVPSSPGSTYWTVSGIAPQANVISANSNNVTNMTGGEARIFFGDALAVKINGGFILSDTPARDNVPATIDPSSPNVTWIPNYEAVVADNRIDANVTIGAEYHFPTKKKLSPYAGVALPFYYARWSKYDPTAEVYTDASTGGVTVTITDVTTRHVEMIGLGGQIYAGADYFVSESLFLGLEIKPFSFIYAYSTKYPAAGLETLQADTYTYGAFTQPLFKVGFMF